MSYDRHYTGSSPPPAYVETAAGGMENEVYIDGTLYVDGVPISRTDEQRRGGRRNQRQENPCEKVFRLTRSNFSVVLLFDSIDNEIIFNCVEIWQTHQTERIDRHQQKDKYVQTTIRELIVYSIFLTILSIGKTRERNIPIRSSSSLHLNGSGFWDGDNEYVHFNSSIAKCIYRSKIR